MNDRAKTPSAAESAQTALQMLTVLQADMSALVTLARKAVEESVMPVDFHRILTQGFHLKLTRQLSA